MRIYYQTENQEIEDKLNDIWCKFEHVDLCNVDKLPRSFQKVVFTGFENGILQNCVIVSTALNCFILRSMISLTPVLKS